MIAQLLLAAAAILTTPDGHRWQVVEADNGAKFAVDVNSISRGANATTAILYLKYTDDDGFHRLIFDCEGHYQDAADLVTHTIAPRSVIKPVEDIVCQLHT